jgi:hypothetical protein
VEAHFQEISSLNFSKMWQRALWQGYAYGRCEGQPCATSLSASQGAIPRNVAAATLSWAAVCSAVLVTHWGGEAGEFALGRLRALHAVKSTGKSRRRRRRRLKNSELTHQQGDVFTMEQGLSFWSQACNTSKTLQVAPGRI